MTTVAVMQCVEKGLLSLDVNVSDILPEWKSPDILSGFDPNTGEPQLKKATKKITLRHLLTHSSGMGYDFLSPLLKRWRDWTQVDPQSIVGIIVCWSLSDNLVLRFRQVDHSDRKSSTHSHFYMNQAKVGSTAAALTGPARWWRE